MTNESSERSVLKLIRAKPPLFALLTSAHESLASFAKRIIHAIGHANTVPRCYVVCNIA